MRVIFALIALVSLVACARQPIKIESTFDPETAKFINVPGKSTISGQLFLRRNDGIVVYGAGSSVTLIPQTTYSRERISKIYGQGKMVPVYLAPSFESEDAEYRRYQKTTKADGQGRFTFSNLSAGEYYVVGPVTWCAPSQYGCNTQGGSLMEHMTLKNNETKDVIMNGL